MILLALGSNLGDRAAMLALAIAALGEAGVRAVAVSSSIETPAMLPADAPAVWNIPFLNLVMQAETDASPVALLEIIKSTEQSLGRKDRGRWGPREIDIDIIAYGDAVMDTPALQLPHPGNASRAFVLRPLAEIAPHWRHPISGKTAAEMLAELA